MFRNIFLFIVAIISYTCSYAQEDVTVTISMSKWKAMEDCVKHLNDSIANLNKVIVSKDTMIVNREKTNEQTFKMLRSANSECAKLNVVINKMKSDSIDNSKMLGDLRSQLLSVQKQLGRVDTMTIQVIITYMNLKCSKSKINTLRKDFANIVNQTIKRDYKEWDTLLSYYSRTYEEVRNIVLDASKKIPSAAMPALKDRYVSEADQKLSNLPYLKLYFSNKNCSSPYLNTMIKEAKTTISISKRADEFNKFLKSYPLD